MKKQLLQPIARLGFMAVFVLFGILSTKAEEAIILTLKDGGEVAFAFSTKPRLVMGEELTISAPDATGVSYPYADVKNVRFGEVTTTDIESASGTGETPDVTFSIRGNQLQVFGLPQGESVSVYNLAGKRVAMQKQTQDATVLNIPLNARGVLVVRTSTGISYRVVLP